mgnify:CR=1 FL=1
MTLDEMKQARTAAGVRYAAAVDELKSALIDLAALDRALNNDNVNPSTERPRSFGHLPINLGEFAHSEFAPGPIGGDWRDEVRTAADVLVSKFKG